ncbi:Cytochrome P450 87A3, partial [Dichanthelium oligosanthes]
LVTTLVVMGVTLITVWLLHLLLKRNSRGRGRCAATLPPGSMGLPLLGETLQFFVGSPSLDLFPFFKRRLEKYGPIFKTNLVGKDLIVSLDPELNNYVFQQEEKAFQIWYPESFMRILGDDNILSSVGSLHKHMRNLVLRVFGPENLRLVLLHDVQSAVKTSLDSWLEKPSIELKAAASSMIFSVTAKWLIGYEASRSSGDLWKHYDTRGVVTFPLAIPGTAFYRCLQVQSCVEDV